MRHLLAFAVGLCLMTPIHAAGGPKLIDVEVRIRASLDAVWAAWTTDTGAQAWFAPKTNIELRAGGAYEILFTPDKPAGQRGAEDLKVLSYLDREMLSFDWSAPPQFERARPQRTWVVVRFTDLGDGSVRVRLTHAGFAEMAAAKPEEAAEWQQVRDYFAKTWPTVLDKCRNHLEKAVKSNDGPQITEGVVEAPLDAVWAAWTTKAGQEAWNVAHSSIDLKVGGKMLAQYDAKGTIGDPSTIENIILAFEPNRMLTIQVGKPPEKFPFKEAIKTVWHVLTFENAGPGRIRVRIVGLGSGADEDSKKVRGFFEQGNAFTMKKLQEHFAKATP